MERPSHANWQYENILAYNIGNEVINLVSNTNAARMFHHFISSKTPLTYIAYVKAAARDIKAYLKGINSGALVGYAAVDGEPAFRDTLAEYLTCGDEDIVVDLYCEWFQAMQHAESDETRSQQLRMVWRFELQQFRMGRHCPRLLGDSHGLLHVRIRVSNLLTINIRADTVDVSPHLHESGPKLNLCLPPQSPMSSPVVSLSPTSLPVTATVWSPSLPMATGKLLRP